MEILALAMAVFVALAVPFVVPIVAWVSARRARHRVDALEAVVAEQREAIDDLIARLNAIVSGGLAPMPPPTAPEREAAAPEPVAPEVTAAEEPPPGLVIPGAPAPEAPAPEPRVAAYQPEAVASPVFHADETASDQRAATGGVADTPPPPFEPAPAPSSPRFDWENLVGVKLFSAIAGIALVLAAVFFLRYSIEHGWLQPPVRVAIGIIVAAGLLVACELKAARRYPATANALDAAAIAILFSTFFAAHALWNLIPAVVTFALLGLVTGLAVLLSIRRESLFIAVLGLLGGFATPAILSTGENRPIPLFAYLLLLNVGLAWVAYRKTWPVLTWLTLILTTAYQWGWVFKFLDRSALPLAMGVFIVFPLASVAALVVGRWSKAEENDPADGGRSFERTALMAAGVPLLFAIYLAAIPEYGAEPGLLFGFLLLIDLGLLAIAISRRTESMHGLGAITTVLAVAIWMAVSYHSAARATLVAFTAAYALIYLVAPVVAGWVGRPLPRGGRRSSLAAPMLLFVFAVLAGIEPAFARPWPLFGPLLVLLLVIAARAVMSGQGSLYYVAAFFAVAAQAIWSATHLTGETLASAVMVYAVFGVAALAVPIAARKVGRPLEPAWGAGAVLIASLAVLMFVAAGDVAPAALWALALLLAILNAALFVESAAGGLPLVSQVGSVLSWLVLTMWWGRAAASVGVMPSLAVLTGLTLVTLAGHAWTTLTVRRRGGEIESPGFGNGLYLSLAGHLFLTLLVFNRSWGIPPWPVFGSLAAITLAMSAASLVTRVAALHAAGAVAAAVVIAAWSWVAGAPPYGLIALIASAVASAYAVVWIRLMPPDAGRTAAAAACAALFVGEVSVLGAVGSGGAPPFVLVAAWHVANIAAILWVASRYGWKAIPVLAVAPAWLATLQWHAADMAGRWQELLILAAALYAVFAAYPFALGRRARGAREPYLAAVVATAMFFFAGRSAFLAGNLEWMIGIVPVAAGGVLALLLRHLLTLEPAGERDIGRLALVAGAALACVTVAIPLQLDEQWITIGWALEGAALAWLFRRVPHRGLLYFSVALLAVVFARLALNPGIFEYEPRGAMRILNWYLYTYLVGAGAMILAGHWLSKTDDGLAGPLPRPSRVLPAAGVILLFLLLNIEIADYYATGPAITFRFGVTVSQDLTYTIGWLVFGMLLLAAGIYLSNRPARIAAVSLIAVTTFKCFLYDFGSLEGLYRVASFVGLAISLALVSLALQKYVLSKSGGTA